MSTVFSGVFRIGRDAELRRIPNGEPIINLSLAYNYGKRNDEGKKPTQWIDAALWGNRAEALAEYLLKGSQIHAVLEDVHIETFKKRDGEEGHKLAARIQSLDFVGQRQERHQDSAPSAPTQRQAPPPARKPAPGPSGFDDFDDDIPF